jgi:hypothetical protein
MRYIFYIIYQFLTQLVFLISDNKLTFKLNSTINIHFDRYLLSSLLILLFRYN